MRGAGGTHLTRRPSDMCVQLKRQGLALILAFALLCMGVWLFADPNLVPPWARAEEVACTHSTGVVPEVSPTPYFYLDPPIVQLVPGSDGQVLIRTSYVESLRAVQVFLHWNPNLAEVVDMDPIQEGVQAEPGDLFAGYNVMRISNSALNASGVFS